MPKQDVTAFSLQYKTWCKDRLAGLVDVKPFEFFCANQFLKSRALTDAEILSGQVDAPHDGGVDAFYCFFNKKLLDDTTVIDPRSGGDVELKIFQCKQGAGFSPTGINKFSGFAAAKGKEIIASLTSFLIRKYSPPRKKRKAKAKK